MSAAIYFISAFKLKTSKTDEQTTTPGGELSFLPIDNELIAWRKLIFDANVNNAVVEIVEELGWVCINPEDDLNFHNYVLVTDQKQFSCSLRQAFENSLKKMNIDKSAFQVLSEFKILIDNDWRFCMNDLEISWLNSRISENSFFTMEEALILTEGAMNFAE